MKVAGIYIYPIKSLQGISLKDAEVLERGFRHDRRWMIVNEEHSHITQRTHPQLSQINISMGKDGISATYKGMADLEIPLVITGPTIEVSVWSDQVQAIEASQNINDWFSQIAQESCKLVFMPEVATRSVNPNRAVNDENVSFADGYPYLIIGQESLDDLNSRMDVDLPMNRFRPNIVVEGGQAYEEDHLSDVKIGEVKFHVTHPCKRCVFTTIDQETGMKGVEPMKTLATYRREGSEVVFGVNTLALSHGKVSIGDTVYSID